MKKTIALFFAFITILIMSACRIEKVYSKDQPVKSYQLNLSNFSEISNKSNCSIHFTQSKTYKVTLKTTQTWYDTHNIKVEDGALVITTRTPMKKKGISTIYLYNDNDAELWISAPSLSDVGTFGSGDFIAESDINGENLSITIAGSGDTSLKGVSLSGSIEYGIAGSGDLKTGIIKAQNAKFTVAGSGDIHTSLDNVNNTEIGISGSGDVDATFNKCVNASVSVSGSGDITLKGQLVGLDKRISGSGDIDTSKLQIGK